MSVQESRRHHFVPKLLLRPWLKAGPGGQALTGYSWDERRRCLSRKVRGLDAFCNQLDLLSLREHKLGRDAIEKVFFGDVDSRGARVRDLLLQGDAGALTGEKRVEFARLLLSLDARRPQNVAKLKNEGASFFATGLNTDQEILDAMKAHGIAEPPSEYYETNVGSLLDRALGLIQRAVDNPRVGGRLVNAHWHVVRLDSDCDSLVLSDRPLVRYFAFDDPRAAWILPLTPTVAFVAANEEQNLEKITDTPGHRLARSINVASARQSERFVFSVDAAHERWLAKYLKRPKRTA